MVGEPALDEESAAHFRRQEHHVLANGPSFGSSVMSLLSNNMFVACPALHEGDLPFAISSRNFVVLLGTF